MISVDRKNVENFSKIANYGKEEKTTGQIRLIDLVKMYRVSYRSLYDWKDKYGSLPPTDTVVLEKHSEFIKNKELRAYINKMESLSGWSSTNGA